MSDPKLLHETASQTAGPYVHIGLMPGWAGNASTYDTELGASPFEQGAKGEVIEITGQVLDGAGAPLPEALIESWQADAAGIYPGQTGADPKVTGFCRFAMNAETMEFTLCTIKPGAVALPGGGVQSPHIALWIVARGINMGLMTRVYFEDADPSKDPVLSAITPPERAQTLIAHPMGQGRYRFDIRLQGTDETVFLDI